MKTQNGSTYSNSKLDHQSNRSQDNGEFRWTVWMAALGIFGILLYVAVCLATGHPVIFYGS
ncbi:MAG: hypothetical protein ABI177_10860 [Edaphobacter sp.]